MGLIDRIGGAFERLSLWWEQQVGCKHLYAEAKVELIPGQEFVRYYRKCACGVEWDE